MVYTRSLVGRVKRFPPLCHSCQTRSPGLVLCSAKTFGQDRVCTGRQWDRAGGCLSAGRKRGHSQGQRGGSRYNKHTSLERNGKRQERKPHGKAETSKSLRRDWPTEKQQPPEFARETQRDGARRRKAREAANKREDEQDKGRRARHMSVSHEIERVLEMVRQLDVIVHRDHRRGTAASDT